MSAELSAEHVRSQILLGELGVTACVDSRHRECRELRGRPARRDVLCLSRLSVDPPTLPAPPGRRDRTPSRCSKPPFELAAAAQRKRRSGSPRRVPGRPSRASRRPTPPAENRPPAGPSPGGCSGGMGTPESARCCSSASATTPPFRSASSAPTCNALTPPTRCGWRWRGPAQRVARPPERVRR